MWLASIITLVLSTGLGVKPHAVANTKNATYTNPILPGFFPDPSCIFVPELNNTFICASSSFLAFPGIPLHVSKDLIHWKLVSHVFNRREQYPSFGNISNNQFGVYAPTIRFHENTFYISVTMFGSSEYPYLENLVFNASDPFDDRSWGIPISTQGQAYDTSLFWEDDGTIYDQGAAGLGIVQWKVDLQSGNITDQRYIWNGTGGVAPEGPHVYKKDGYYYLMIAEGGSGDAEGTAATKHHESIARSRNVIGPYESNPANPILSNVNTTQYFTGTGHVDLFKDARGNWWGVALATRGGPKSAAYPMGRETVLFPVSWEAGEWPVFDQVRGIMSGPLPPTDLDIHAHGRFIGGPDIVEFGPGSDIPIHFTYWRFPISGAYTVSPAKHPHTLRLVPSALNLTGSPNHALSDGQTFISRRQTDTLFTYSVDINFLAAAENEEVGVSVFLTQDQHLDLGLTKLNNVTYLRFRGRSSKEIPPAEILHRVDTSWLAGKVRFQIDAFNATHYRFLAGKVEEDVDRVPLREIAVAPASLVSGGYTGTLVGVYATTNGGNGSTPAYVSRWRYLPRGQGVDFDTWVYPDGHC
ncbi:xylosidase : arabinofuranosidase [Aureobasidium pullulans]|uniref:Xylosidase: arabinofuranosidase n=1 Tax=Aureobasidium pullulans TaxID=5580 RepID=A0A4S9FA71_AURPU|nr:xylosidase : arabinofuranosidase [Aureobasidium pullulans]